MGHESRIEPWLPMTTVLLVSFRTDWLRREDTMKTAWKETGNRWAAVFSIRMDGAAGQNRTCSSTWGWKQEKFQRWGKCFLLTSPSIEHPRRRKREDSHGLSVCFPEMEERRVGKECRSRWALDHYKKEIENVVYAAGVCDA